MQLELKKVLEVTEMSPSEVHMIERIFGLKGEDTNKVSFDTLLIVLVWDFFKRSGMALESFASALPPFTEKFKDYTVKFLAAIDEYREKKTTHIPRCFVTLIDNQFVGLYYDSSAPIKLWDMMNDKEAGTLLDYKPVFTLTLSVPMLYFKVAARTFGHFAIAEACRQAPLWSAKPEDT